MSSSECVIKGEDDKLRGKRRNQQCATVDPHDFVECAPTLGNGRNRFALTQLSLPLWMGHGRYFVEGKVMRVAASGHDPLVWLITSPANVIALPSSNQKAQKECMEIPSNFLITTPYISFGFQRQ